MLDAVGQSGHVLSPRYADALKNWSEGQARAMRMDRAAAERNAAGVLRLTPASH
jgi:acyl-homoserine lactone acylase PvdQ